MTTNDSDTTPVPEKKASYNASAPDAAFNFDWSKLKPLVRPAEIGLLSALFLVIVVVGYTWGFNVSSNSGNTGSLASAWSVILIAVTILFGLLVAVGVPVWWTRGKGLHKALVVIAFEVIFLTIALLISGYVLFSGNNINSTGNNQVNPGGPSCSESAYGC